MGSQTTAHKCLQSTLLLKFFMSPATILLLSTYCKNESIKATAKHACALWAHPLLKRSSSTLHSVDPFLLGISIAEITHCASVIKLQTLSSHASCLPAATDSHSVTRGYERQTSEKCRRRVTDTTVQLVSTAQQDDCGHVQRVLVKN